MAGKLVPPGLLALEPAWRNALENILTIQFQHRVIASTLSVAAFVIACRALWRGSPALRPPAVAVAVMALVQPTLGVVTLLLYLPLSFAALHQMGGFLFFSSLVWLTHALRHPGVDARSPALHASERLNSSSAPGVSTRPHSAHGTASGS